MSRFSFWALAVAAPAGSYFLLPVFPPTFSIYEHEAGMTRGAGKERLKLLFFILQKPALKLEYRRTKKNKLFSFMAFLSLTYCPLYTCA